MNTAILVPTETLMAELGIKKDAYYADIKFLGIEIIKDNSGKSHVSENDARRMNSLRQWINKTGTRRGFVDNSEEIEADSALSTVGDNELAQTEGKQADEDIYVQPSNPEDQFDVHGLIREAAELKAREIAMPALVKRALADKLEEEELPEDLQEKIGLAREAANPKFKPDMVATSILPKFRPN